MKKISTRQLIIFFCIYSFSIKFLALPQLLSQTAGRDAWVAAAIGTVLELLILFAILNVLVIGNGSDLYSDLRHNTTWVGGKSVITLMLVLFLLQLFILISTSYSMVTQNLFHDMTLQTFLIPLVLFGMLFCFVSARAIFRSGEIFYLLIILGLILSVVPALTQMRPAEVTPMLENGAQPLFNGVYKNLIYFESASFLLIFSGDVKITKDFKKKFMTVATLVGLAFVFFVFMAVALFGTLAPYKEAAIANLTVYSSFLTQGGRIDWILICIWLLLLLMRFGVTFYCVFACIRYLFNLKHRAGYIGLGIAATLWAVYTFAIITKTRLDDFVVVAAPAIATLVLLIPLVCFVNALVLKRRARNG